VIGFEVVRKSYYACLVGAQSRSASGADLGGLEVLQPPLLPQNSIATRGGERRREEEEFRKMR